MSKSGCHTPLRLVPTLAPTTKTETKFDSCNVKSFPLLSAWMIWRAIIPYEIRNIKLSLRFLLATWWNFWQRADRKRQSIFSNKSGNKTIKCNKTFKYFLNTYRYRILERCIDREGMTAPQYLTPCCSMDWVPKDTLLWGSTKCYLYLLWRLSILIVELRWWKTDRVRRLRKGWKVV